MPSRPYDHSYYDDYHDRQDPDDFYRRPPTYDRSYSERMKQARYPPDQKQPEKKQASTGKTLAALFIVIILIMSLLISSVLIFSYLEPFRTTHREVPEKINFTVEKEVIISTSVSDGSPMSISYKASVPKDRGIADVNLQNVISVNPTPRPDNGYPDISDTDQEFMRWEEQNFRGTLVISITYSISTMTFVWDMSEEDSGTVNDIPQEIKDQYLNNEWKIDYDQDNELDAQDDIDDDGAWDYLIEVSDPGIEDRAYELTSWTTNVYSQVKSIYDYLTSPDNLNYVTTSAKTIPQDCASTLRLLKGDCDDYSILFVSLARAAGIPSWLELGVIYDPDNGKWGAHAWAKICIPFTDGTYTIATVDIVNQEFLVHDAYRFTEWIDTGGDILVEGKFVNNLEYYYHSFSYIIPSNGNTFPTIQESYSTESYREFGDRIEIPIENAEEDQQTVPSFELGLLVLTVVVIVVIKKLPVKKIR